MSTRPRRLETDAEIFEMAGLQPSDILTPEARALYESKAEDGFSLKNVFFERYLDAAVRRWNELRFTNAEILAPLSLTPKQLEVCAGSDATAPREEVCAYCLAQAVFEMAAAHGLKINLEKLKRASRNRLAGAMEKLRPFREEALKNRNAHFHPRRWKKVLEDGSFEKNKVTGEFKEYGSAVLCEFDDHTIGDQLELALALGIEFPPEGGVRKILFACNHAGNWDAQGKWLEVSTHLYCLQTFSGKMVPRKKNGRIVYGRFRKPQLTNLCLPAEPYRNAEKRLARLNEDVVEGSRRMIDPHLVKDHSCFALSFDCLPKELDGKIDACASELEMRKVISEFFQQFTAEQIGEMKILLGENLGDKAEGKTLGRDGDRGKPPGIGPFGGKPEPDDKNIGYDLESLLPPLLYRQAEDDPLFKRLVMGFIREVQNESGFAIAKIYCRVAVIPKGNNSHLYHLWLVRMKNPVDGGQSVPVKEYREMSMSQMRFWIPLKDVFSMQIGGLDAAFRRDRVYCGTLINLKEFIHRFGLAVPPEAKKFEEKLNNSRKRDY
jgi:hypothetical protein